MSNYLTGIVLSAGLSGRMNSFKPLLKLENKKTFIQNIVEKLIQVCDEVVVVTGFKADDVENNLATLPNKNNITIAYNKNYKEGMFSSLQTGLRYSDSKWYLYHFVDQPSLPNEFYSEFIKQVDNQVNWIQPTKGNQKGHPILFDDKTKKLILTSAGDITLREISKNDSIIKKFWECSTELIFQDVDTLADYKIITNTTEKF